MSADETVPMDPAPAAVASRRPPVALVALAVVVALAVLWVFVVSPLLLGDGDDTAPVAASTDAASGADTDAASAADEPAPGDTEVPAIDTVPAVTYEVFLARDPFEPVVPEDDPEPETTGDVVAAGTVEAPTLDPPQDPEDGTASGTGRGTSSTDGGTTSDTGTRADDGPEAADPSASSAGNTCTGERGDEAACQGRIVTLVRVTRDDDGPLAVVQVGTTVHEVRVGDAFAGTLRLAGVTGSCADLQHGDDAFRLCEGDRVLK
ncbi:hypothetical protein FTX61_09040 [Nitriliruptoraceae bacterium ZYF776]|nr:hypothetical protein [Profundirhabdus halotolerans]